MLRFHTMPFGAELIGSGVRFAIWAPTANSVSLVVDGAEHPLSDEGSGWRRVILPGARSGSRYGYRIDGDLVVPDPASRFQPDDVHGLSQVVDPQSFKWNDDAWKGRPWEETVFSEVHVGTVTPEGSYAALAAKLQDFKDAGITAIELMPLSEFPGRRNWGYDGVLPYAPDATYGTPEDLKRLIDRAHALGLMVFLDVVYNHFGPSGNYLHAYAGSFFTERHHTPWGAGINVDGADATPVRDFFVHNALYWLEEYHFDGLRFDAVHAIEDDSARHIVAEIAERVRDALPGRYVHLVLENDHNTARWLRRRDDGRPALHTAQWNDDVHHCWHTLLTGESDGYYGDYADDPVRRLGRCLAEGFAYQGEPSPHRKNALRGEPSGHLSPSSFVGFLQNHDQIGNRAFGERLTELAAPERLDLARAGLLLAPQIPLLFMGEEWGARTPFLFFVDFADDPALQEAVREGRKREFNSFKSFAERSNGREIPDPTLQDTAERSTLDWSEPQASPHREILEQTRSLLALRRAEIAPLLRSRFLGASYQVSPARVLSVTWRFADDVLHFTANFGADEAAMDGGARRVVWTNAPGTGAGAGLKLPPWTGLFTKGDAR